MRTSYCKPVGRFVATYDHFCPFLNTPVGERNHCRFLVLCAAQMATVWWAICITYTAVTWRNHEKAGVAHAIGVLCALWVLELFALGLAGFHAFLALANLTTREFMRAEKVDYLRGTEDFDLPFAKGPCSNVWLFVTLDGAYAALRGREWRPHEWTRPAVISRDSEDWKNNLWQNKYWSCC